MTRVIAPFLGEKTRVVEPFLGREMFCRERKRKNAGAPAEEMGQSIGACQDHSGSSGQTLSLLP